MYVIVPRLGTGHSPPRRPFCGFSNLLIFERFKPPPTSRFNHNVYKCEIVIEKHGACLPGIKLAPFRLAVKEFLD